MGRAGGQAPGLRLPQERQPPAAGPGDGRPARAARGLARVQPRYRRPGPGGRPAGATIAFRTTLSISVAFTLNATTTLPNGYAGTGEKPAGSVSSTLVLGLRLVCRRFGRWWRRRGFGFGGCIWRGVLMRLSMTMCLFFRLFVGGRGRGLLRCLGLGGICTSGPCREACLVRLA